MVLKQKKKKSNIKKALIAYKEDLALGKVSTAQLVTVVVVDQDEYLTVAEITDNEQHVVKLETNFCRI